MTTTNHPDDELLARFADADPEALGDSAMSGHLAACDRCSTLVADLRSLHLALAAMPDPTLKPPRPLRLLPPVDAPPATFADRVATVIRRAFAPAMTAGAALALIGVVGTTGIGTNFAQSAAGGPDAAEPEVAQDAAETLAGEEGFTAAELATPTAPAEPAQRDAAAGAESAETEEPTTLSDRLPPVGEEEPAQGLQPIGGVEPAADAGTADASDRDLASSGEPDAELAAERPIWPMLLFSGVALMMGAVVLRWIFQPRAT